MAKKSQGRPRAFDTDKALDDAMMLFWKQGYEGTSVDELCNAMGIGKQSMYDWIGGKRDLYIASLNRYRETKVSNLPKVLFQEGSPIANFKIFLNMMAEYAKTENCMGCFQTNAQSEFGTDDEGVHNATQNTEDFVISVFRQFLQNAKAAGEISSSLDVDATASALAVFRNGIMIAGRSGQSKESINQTISLIEGLLMAT